MISGGYPAQLVLGIDPATAARAMPAPPCAAGANGGTRLRAAVFAVDRLLRRWYGVREFSPARDNLLRISTGTAGQRVVLGDGTEVAPGDPVIDLHLWNERIPALGSFPTGLGWGSRARRRIERSLMELAAHVEADPAVATCMVCRAEAVFLTGLRPSACLRIAERLGFDTAIAPRPAGPGHTLLAIGFAWACHPGAPMRRRRRVVRYTFWMSRRTLRARYLRHPGVTTAAPDGCCPEGGSVRQ